MKVYITEFYMHPRYNFDVSHRVFKYLDQCINKKIKTPTKDDDTSLTIILDTRRIKKTKINERVKWGPRNKKDFKQRVYLPYESLKKSRKFQYDFINVVCDAVNEIMKDYNIPEKYLSDIKKQCLAEIPGNSKYIFDDEQS